MSPFSLLALLAAPILVSAQEVSILPYPALPSCTSTITHRPQCCPKLAATTATSYTDCGGCALEVVTKGPMCMMFCATPTPIDPSKTTTVTKCGPSTTPSIATSYVEKPPSASCTSQGPSAPASVCTSTVIEKNPFPCGDCGVGIVDVSTTVDCKGCVLETTTSAGGVGICMCPTAPATRTVSVCAASVSAVPTAS